MSSGETCKEATVVFSASVLSSLIFHGADEESEGILYGTASTAFARVLTDGAAGDGVGSSIAGASHDGDASQTADGLTADTTIVVTHAARLGSSLSFYDHLGRLKNEKLADAATGRVVGFFRFRRRFRPPAVVSLRENAVYAALASRLVQQADAKRSSGGAAPILSRAGSLPSGNAAADASARDSAPVFLLITSSTTDSKSIHNFDYACFRKSSSDALSRISISIANIHATRSEDAFASVLRSSAFPALERSISAVQYAGFADQLESVAKASLEGLKSASNDLAKVQEDYLRLVASLEAIKAKGRKAKRTEAR
ncbi:hypothetical protein DFJ74DRAFT_654238 [Hyaloraphidium curvatum]|nr:hypothetical protein DFJ74DRAFT_654238 [Hyaloraphidium curvatum]